MSWFNGLYRGSNSKRNLRIGESLRSGGGVYNLRLLQESAEYTFDPSENHLDDFRRLCSLASFGYWRLPGVFQFVQIGRLGSFRTNLTVPKILHIHVSTKYFFNSSSPTYFGVKWMILMTTMTLRPHTPTDFSPGTPASQLAGWAGA